MLRIFKNAEKEAASSQHKVLQPIHFLLACLKEKEGGYEYAIIGGAGPIEFYEQACQAVVIPTTNF